MNAGYSLTSNLMGYMVAIYTMPLNMSITIANINTNHNNHNNNNMFATGYYYNTVNNNHNNHNNATWSNTDCSKT